jgi:hypothetical protein
MLCLRCGERKVRACHGLATGRAISNEVMDDRMPDVKTCTISS